MTELEYNNHVKEYADNIYRFVLKNLKNVTDAEDIVQSTFETFWVQRANVNAETPKSLLFTIAYRKMIDLIRKNKRTTYHDTMSLFERGEEIGSGNNLKEILNRALDTLDETKKSLVLLKDYEGYSYEEIGKITSLSESQVKVYLHRARLQLREYLVKIENVI